MANFLYNGVELPDINTVWTDKTKYPCATVFKVDGLYYRVALGKTFWFDDVAGTKFKVTAPYAQYWLSNNAWEYEVGGDSNNWTINSRIEWVVWSSVDLKNPQGTVLLSASEPVDPNAPAEPETPHITTSSGNGFALYGTHYLPDIGSKWNKTTRPKAIVAVIDGGRFGFSGTQGYLFASTSNDIYTDDNHFIDIDSGLSGGISYCFMTTDSAFNNFIIANTNFEPAVNAWGTVVESSVSTTIDLPFSIIWSSFDVENTDSGSVVSTASIYASLDGFTVIQWDGDTTGLEGAELDLGEGFYIIGDYVNPTEAYGVYGGSNGFFVADTITRTNVGWNVNNGAYIAAFGDADDNSFGFLKFGEPLSGNGNLYSNGYTRIFAYRTTEAPPEEGGEEPVITETSGDGFALYNGVKLPDIDTVWTDKTAYPYAIIDVVTAAELGMSGDGVVYQLDLFSKLVGYANGGYIVDTSYSEVVHTNAFCTFDADIGEALGVIGEWCVINSDFTTTGIQAFTALWTSHDVLDQDGSTYLAASDPIPLDGMTVIEWNGGTAGLTNSGTGLYKITDDVLASNQVIGGVFVQNVSSKLTAIPITTAKVSAYENGISINSKIYSAPANTLMPEAGTYFVKLVGDYVSLFAYPTSGGGGGGGSNPPITGTINITYKGNTKLEAGKTATLKCIGKNCVGDIIAQFGVSGSIIYNGKETMVEAGKTATINCYLKNMLTDVVIKANKS